MGEGSQGLHDHATQRDDSPSWSHGRTMVHEVIGKCVQAMPTHAAHFARHCAIGAESLAAWPRHPEQAARPHAGSVQRGEEDAMRRQLHAAVTRAAALDAAVDHARRGHGRRHA